MSWARYTYSQVLLSQRVFWQDMAFAIVGALMPIAMALAPAFAFHGQSLRPGLSTSAYLLPGGMAICTVWILYTAINSAARRRDSLVYKRLRACMPDSSILVGEATSAALPAIGQAVLVVVVGVAALNSPAPANIPLLVVGLLLSAAAFAFLAFGISGVLPSGEVSTWLITPFVFGLWYVSGAITPLSDFPAWLANASHYLPATAAVDMARTAYFSADFSQSTTDVAPHSASFAQTAIDCGRPALVLLVWAVIGAALWKKFFRWDPRHSN